MANETQKELSIDELKMKLDVIESEKKELLDTIKKLTDENNVLIIKNNKLITLYSALFNQVLNME